MSASHATIDLSCPPLYKKGVLPVDMNPAFLHIDKFDDGGTSLLVPSFFNIEKDPVTGRFMGSYLDRDKVGLIRDITNVDFDNFDAVQDMEVITDMDLGRYSVDFGKNNWTNDAVRAPDDFLPFEAVVLPQGFHSAPVLPGRLSILNMSDPTYPEYIIQQSTQNGGFSFPGDPNNTPRFYHQVHFVDMDGDGLKDIITSRSGFRVGPSGFHPPFGELLWFKNPGADLDPNTPWEETIIWGGPAAGFQGPDINLDVADLDGDGIVEIVATHFFTGPDAMTLQGKIAVYGAPVGGTWADVNASAFMLPQVADISIDQGAPFGVELVDLNKDGKLDVLASNHQPDNCSPPTSSEVPGRVYALEMPADGDIFNSPWTTHILKDNIRPNPSTDPVSPPGRLAPGVAKSFYPLRFLERFTKPNVIVGGDEAAKVWVLTPKKPWDPNNWEYRSAVVFDINDYYGENTTQTLLDEPSGVTISTVGGLAVSYTNEGPFGLAEFYVPVFEGRDIHVFTYNPGGWGRKGRNERVDCIDEDAPLACPLPPAP